MTCPAPHAHQADPGKEERARAGLPVVAAFDGFRALAILGIVVLHLIGISGVWNREEGILDEVVAGVGPWLVNVLFIVSGFVVFLPTVAQDGRFGSVGSYAIRRAARLLPAFWLSLLIVILLLGVLPSGPQALPDAGEIALNFSGMHEIAPLFDPGSLGAFGVNPPIWTLTLEICFYIVLPFVAVGFFRHPVIGLLVAAGIALAWRLVSDNLMEISDAFGLGLEGSRASDLRFASFNQLPSWAFSFAAGMAGAWVYVAAHRRLEPGVLAKRARLALFASSVALLFFMYLSARKGLDNPPILAALLAQRDPVVNLGLTAALATAMVAFSLSSGRQRPFSSPLARRLGDISYGVFLIHYVIIWAVQVEFSPPVDGTLGALAIWTAIVVPPSLLYGYLSARWLEQPIRRWARRFGQRAQAQPLPP